MFPVPYSFCFLLSQLLSGLFDSHSVVREKCAVYLVQILGVSKSADVESVLSPIVVGMKNGLADNDAKSRAAWRSVFESLSRHCPQQMAAVQESLPAAAQKAIEADRKAKTSKPANKRKK